MVRLVNSLSQKLEDLSSDRPAPVQKPDTVVHEEAESGNSLELSGALVQLQVQRDPASKEGEEDQLKHLTYTPHKSNQRGRLWRDG